MGKGNHAVGAPAPTTDYTAYAAAAQARYQQQAAKHAPGLRVWYRGQPTTWQGLAQQAEAAAVEVWGPAQHATPANRYQYWDFALEALQFMEEIMEYTDRGQGLE